MQNAKSRRHPSRFAANVYLIVGIAALILTGGSETTLGHYLIGSAVEIGLALLILLFLRIEKVPTRSALRIRRPEPQIVGLGVALVPAFWLSGIVLNLIAVIIFGYVTPLPPTAFPANLAEALALAATTMIVAPICEELMFRGYVFRAYENRRVWIGIGVTSLIFALYHLRLQGVFALIPISIGLGVITWRTQSVIPSMAMHAAYNGISTVIMIATSFLPMQSVGVITGMVICLGLLAAPFSILAMLALWKKTSPDAAQRAIEERGWLRWAWIIPLLGLILVYGYGAASEFVMGRFPRQFSDQKLSLTVPEDWQRPIRLVYEIQNPMGDKLGEAECIRLPRDNTYTLQCSADYEGFNLFEEIPGFSQLDAENVIDTLPLPEGVPSLSQMLKGKAGAWHIDAEWQRETAEQPTEGHPPEKHTLSLQTLTGARTSITRTITTTLTSAPMPILTTETPGGQQMVMEPDGSLYLMHEWPWRLEGLPFEIGYGGTVTLITLNEDGLPVSHQAYVRVRGGEPTWTQDDTMITWRVTLTYEDPEERTLTAWYREDPPHTLVRYDDGQVIYVLHSKTEIDPDKVNDLLH
jgi:membrane protease YdiL (CAAX protease family)